MEEAEEVDVRLSDSILNQQKVYEEDDCDKDGEEEFSYKAKR